MTGVPTSWTMFAERRARDGAWVFEHFGTESWVRLCCDTTPILVRLVEDPAGRYYGWLPAGTGWLPAGAAVPVMVQPSWPQFMVQFPYGADEVGRTGRGRVVRLRVEEA